MDRTRRTTTANQNQRGNQRKCKEGRGLRPTNARKEDERRKGKVVLSLFRDSPKEGAFMYTDWCREVEEYIQKGYDDNRIKDAMLSSVEGQAYVNFPSCDEGRNCTPARGARGGSLSMLHRSEPRLLVWYETEDRVDGIHLLPEGTGDWQDAVKEHSGLLGRQHVFPHQI